MSMSIRRAEKRDAAAISILMTDLSGHPVSLNDMLNRLQLVAESPIDSLFVCEKNGEILGLPGFRIR